MVVSTQGLHCRRLVGKRSSPSATGAAFVQTGPGQLLGAPRLQNPVRELNASDGSAGAVLAGFEGDCAKPGGVPPRETAGVSQADDAPGRGRYLPLAMPRQT